MVKISVIVPVYNVENTLANTLDSILNQTFKDFEIICVNDKSPDNSYKVIEDYMKNHSNISVINHEENQGLSAARNSGINAAKGEFVSFIDSDDTISQNFLEELYNLAINKNADITMCNLEIDTGSKIIANKIQEVNYTNFKDKIKFLQNGSSCDKLWKTELLKSHDLTFPTGIYYEDNYFILQALYFSNKFCTTNKASYFYRINPNSITNAQENNSKRKTSALKLIDMILDFAKVQNFSKEELYYTKLFSLTSFIYKNFLNDKEFFYKLPDEIKYDKKLLSFYDSAAYKNIFERIFSFKNSRNLKYKVITILGTKLKIKRKKKHG